jgi:7-cyano-7-deazaguanine synthase
MTKKAFVLLSGGIDSTTCLYIAHDQYDGNVEGVSINYGQRHLKESEYAAMSCEELGIPHKILSIEGLIPETMLTNKDIEIPNISYDEIKGVSPTYVPFRNGLLLSTIASYVQGRRIAEGIEYNREANYEGKAPEWGIYFGAHAEDAQNWAYPDCTPEFIGAMCNAVYVGTYSGIRLHCPLEWLDKEQIVRWGDDIGVNWNLTWSCYKGEEYQCGTCPTCRARRQGFRAAGVTDPTKYARSDQDTEAA